MNELAEEDNYSTTSITTRTRSKTSNSFKPISLSSTKDKQKKPSVAKNLLNNNLKVTYHLNKLVLKLTTHSKTKDNRSCICCSLCKDYSCAAITAKDIFLKKQNFMPPFYVWGSTGSRLVPLRVGSLLFTTKFPDIPGTHFIKL